MFNRKPRITYCHVHAGFTSADYELLQGKLTEINIIKTKSLVKPVVDFCLKNKDSVFMHVLISGLGGTILEPNTPRVRDTFNALKLLVDSGFPMQRIAVIVSPIIPNENGLKAVELLLRLFTEFKALRLRFIRFDVLSTDKINKMLKQSETKKYSHINLDILKPDENFWLKYQELIEKYNGIITIDKNVGISVTELLTFNINNSWVNIDGSVEPVLIDTNINKIKGLRCKVGCIICPC